MKNTYLYRLCTVAVATCLMWGTASFAEKTAPKSSARFINIETPFRCAVNRLRDLDIATTLALKDDDFKLTFFDKMDNLPRYEVNGLSFTKQPIDEALQKLVDEADITVYTEDGFYPSMDAKDVYGELTDVVDELTKAGEVFYRYDAMKKELYLSRRGRFELQLPNSRTVMLALLDALRGAGITNVNPDWKNNTILMSLTASEKETVEDLIGYIEKDGYLLLADTQVYTVRPKGNANWQKVIRRFGAGRVYSANNGLSGKVLNIGNQIPQERMLAAIDTEFDIEPVSQGMAIVPNGWKMRFNVGQCSFRNDMASLSVLLNARILAPEKIETNIVLDSKQGEISSFNTVSAIDNELVIVGVPVPDSPADELMATLKLRLIRLVREK
ncbi:MAG: hypothetical protein IJV07_03405 [Alphaproteobacteria bacterium]|nr:hypothetical protein [Alphaproteobacteria bacterium]